MKMIVNSAAAILFATLVSCTPQAPAPPAKPKTSNLVNGGPPALDTIKLEKRADGLFYQVAADKPFTGTDIEPDEKKIREENRLGFVMVTPYAAGKIHGTMRIYYKSGQLQEERVYDQGAARLSTIYHSNGAKKTHVAYNAKGVAEGPYTRWHDNGKTHTEGIFDENEKFHGEFKKFDDQGNLIAHYVMEHGKVAKVMAESPEQKTERFEKSGPMPGEQR